MENTRTYIEILKDVNEEYIKDEKRNESWRCKNIIITMPFYETKFYEDYYKYALQTYDRLNSNKNLQGLWKLAMIPSSEGFNDYNRWDEFTFKLNDIVSSTWHIKQNHHYFKYQELTGKSINDFDRIVEFGGGCGDMCKFIKQMGFKGEYVIIDLPEIHEIQKNNLSTYYDVKFETNPVEKNNKRTLFIATWSISETTLQLRNEIINRLKPEEYLIVYQRQFEDISNENWFKNWDGHREELPWIVWDGGSHYILK